MPDIAASNRNLREQSEIGNFRRDLYFRLSIFEITLPPLRACGDDVLLLADYFIKMLDRTRFKSRSRQLSPEVVKVFRHYEWIGNTRELRNAIERVLILEDSEQITMKYLPLSFSLYDHYKFPTEKIDLNANNDSHRHNTINDFKVYPSTLHR